MRSIGPFSSLFLGTEEDVDTLIVTQTRVLLPQTKDLLLVQVGRSLVDEFQFFQVLTVKLPEQPRTLLHVTPKNAKVISAVLRLLVFLHVTDVGIQAYRAIDRVVGANVFYMGVVA